MKNSPVSLQQLHRVLLKLTRRCAAALWRSDANVVRHKNLLWLLDRRNSVDRKIISGGYEDAQIAHLLSSMEGGCDVFVDVGANFGLYSLQIAASGRVRHLIALEPDPRNYAQLLANLYLNEMATKVQTHCLAASDREGMVAFEVYPASSTGQSRIITEAARSSRSIEVPTKPLDTLLPQAARRLFFKIDVEGHEIAVLRGSENLLRTNDCFLQIESWPENADALKSYMQSIGYRCIHTIKEDYYFDKASLPTS